MPYTSNATHYHTDTHKNAQTVTGKHIQKEVHTHPHKHTHTHTHTHTVNESVGVFSPVNH